MSRWAELSWPERHLVHHALRVLASRWPDSEDATTATALADEIWAEHCENVERLHPYLRSRSRSHPAPAEGGDTERSEKES